MSERDFGIDAEAFHQAAAALSEASFDDVAARIVAPTVRKAANAVRRNVRAQLRAHRRTGKTAGRVRTKPQGRGLGLQVVVSSGGAAAHLIAGGVRPHPIAVGVARAMPIRSGGQVEGFATVVQHPGFGADPFFSRGVAAAVPEINELAGQAAEAMAAELAQRMKGTA